MSGFLSHHGSRHVDVMSEPNTQQTKSRRPPPPRFYVSDLKPDLHPAWFRDDEPIPLARPCEKARLTTFQADAVLDVSKGGNATAFSLRRGVPRRAAVRAIESAALSLQRLSDFQARRVTYWREVFACWSNRDQSGGAEPLVGLLPYVDYHNASSPEECVRLLQDPGNYRTVVLRGKPVTTHDLPAGAEAFLVEMSADLHNG